MARYHGGVRRRLFFALATLALAGCESMSVSSLWPFGDSEIQEKDRRPANAVEYRCGDGKRFFVRNVAMTFDRYLKSRTGDKPVFSRTV